LGHETGPPQSTGERWLPGAIFIPRGQAAGKGRHYT
jgi:hypothetical protein